MTIFKHYISYAIFPVIVFGSLLTALLTLSWGENKFLVTGFLLSLATLLILLCERIIPHNAAWNKSRGDLKTDLSYFLVNNLLSPVNTMLVVYVFSRIAALLPIEPHTWPAHWPMIFQLILALLIREFFQYWLHRISHEFEFILSRCHMIHHTPERLYWLNAQRIHYVNLFADAAVGFGPLIILGAPQDTLLMLGLVIATANLLQHANLELKHGVLNYVFNTNELHRYHHADSVHIGNCNYGDVIVVWDLIFGSYCPANKDSLTFKVGPAGSGFLPCSYLAQLAYPFRKFKTETTAPADTKPSQQDRQ